VLFESSVTAQKNRVREFNAAKLIRASPIAKLYLLTFGRNLAEILQKCYPGEEFAQKKNDMFRYYRDNQSSAVRVEDNLFLKRGDKRAQVGEDTTLRADSKIRQSFGFDKYGTEDLLNEIFRKARVA